MPMPPPGVYAPLLTLYDAGEEIDVAGTAALGRRLVDAGLHGLVVSGSTGEFHLHTPVERQVLLEAVIAACPGTPVLVQVGAPAQRDAMALAAHAVAAGAAGVMLITPYYNRVGPKELADFAHLRAHVYRLIKREQSSPEEEARRAEEPSAPNVSNTRTPI